MLFWCFVCVSNYVNKLFIDISDIQKTQIANRWFNRPQQRMVVTFFDTTKRTLSFLVQIESLVVHVKNFSLRNHLPNVSQERSAKMFYSIYLKKKYQEKQIYIDIATDNIVTQTERNAVVRNRYNYLILSVPRHQRKRMTHLQ